MASAIRTYTSFIMRNLQNIKRPLSPAWRAAIEDYFNQESPRDWSPSTHGIDLSKPCRKIGQTLRYPAS